LHNLADLLITTGNLTEARKQAEEALSLRKDLGENSNIAISQLQLATIAFYESRANDAEVPLRDAFPVFQKANMLDLATQCRALQASVLLAQGKIPEASQTAASAQELAKGQNSRQPKFDAALAQARVRIAEGKTGEATSAAQDVLKQSVRYGYVGYQLEA